MRQRSKEYVSYSQIGWIFYVFVAILIGISSIYVNPVFIIVAIIGILNVFLILKYPMWGLIIYLLVFLLRPGELFPALAIIRPELLTASLVILAIILQRKYEFGDLILPRDRITITLITILIAISLSFFISYEKSQTSDIAVQFIKLLLFYYMIISLIITKKRFVTTMTIFVFIITYIAFDSFRSYLMGGFVHTMNVDRLTGTTSAGGDANALGATLVTTIPIMAALMLYYRNYLLKFVFACMSVFMVIMMVVTGSRSALLAFAGIVFVGISYSRHKVALFVLVIFLSIIGWFLLPQQYQDRYMRFTEIEDNLNDVSSGRIDIWLAGIRMIPVNPLLGVGAGAFAWAYSSGEYGPPHFMQSHNLYLEVICTMGVVGITSWSFFIIVFLKKLMYLSRIRCSGESIWIVNFSKSFIIIICALLISGLFGHNLYRYTWYMLAGLTLALDNIWKKEYGKAED